MVESAGFVVIDFSDSEHKVLCLLNDWKQWDFPKGRLEHGEDKLTAALRETEEECGLSLSDFRPIEKMPISVTYPSGKDTKTATYFMAERISTTIPYLPINPELGKAEHIAWRWIPISGLHKIMPRRLSPLVIALEQIAAESSY